MPLGCLPFQAHLFFGFHPRGKHTWKAAVSAAIAASACFQLTAVELITNGGFEECEEGCTPPAQCQNLSDSLRLSGWTWGGNVGMTKSYSSCPWLRVGTLNGDYALYFQKNSSITQTIDVVDAGAYVVSFGYIARADNTCYAKGRFYVEIDGVEIGHADCGTCHVRPSMPFLCAR